MHRCCPSVRLSVCLFVCLFVCLSVAKMQKNAIFSKTKQFRDMVSIDALQEVVHFKEPITGPLKSKMAEIRHLENRHDVIFCALGGPIWIKLRRLVQNDMSTSRDMVKIQIRCKNPIWRTFGRMPWHVIPEPRTTLQGAATW